VCELSSGLSSFYITVILVRPNCRVLFVCFARAKAKRQYEKSHRESEKALEAYRKSDADIHLSRADVEKVSMMTRLKKYF